jgi:hypothetical protein
MADGSKKFSPIAGLGLQFCVGLFLAQPDIMLRYSGNLL